MNCRIEVVLALALALGCTQEPLRNQARYEPLEASALFEDGASARPLPPGTIPDSQPIDRFTPPARITPEDLERGRRDYAIHCTPCHGQLGDGDGMVVRQGYPPPEPLSVARLRGASLTHLMRVIAEGQGVMFGYADVLDPLARWRVAQWVRVLQLSAHAPLELLQEHERP
jgi:mono/diheme cytochrome c family protein